MRPVRQYTLKSVIPKTLSKHQLFQGSGRPGLSRSWSPDTGESNISLWGGVCPEIWRNTCPFWRFLKDNCRFPGRSGRSRIVDLGPLMPENEQISPDAFSTHNKPPGLSRHSQYHQIDREVPGTSCTTFAETFSSTEKSLERRAKTGSNNNAKSQIRKLSSTTFSPNRFYKKTFMYCLNFFIQNSGFLSNHEIF